MQQTNKIAELGCTNQEVSQANACLVSSLGLSPDFIGIIGYAPRLTRGTNFVGPNPSYLLSEPGRNEFLALYGLPPGQPYYDPTRDFDSPEPPSAPHSLCVYHLPSGPLPS